MKERNLSEIGRPSGIRVLRAGHARRGCAPAAPHVRHRRRPSGGQGRRASLARRSGRLRPRQRHRYRGGPRGGTPRRRVSIRVRLVLVGVWRQHAVPFREDAVAIEPVSPYAATKRAGELLLDSVAPIYGFRAASLRFFTVYGPRQRPDLAIHAFARKMVKGETLTLFGDGTQARDYTYCDDIVAGVTSAVDWTETAPARRRDLQPRRQPLDPHRRHGRRDRGRPRDRAPDRVGTDAARRRAAHRGRPQQIRSGARLCAR